MKKLLFAVVGIVLIVMVIYWAIPAAPVDESSGGYIDMHVHIGCIGAGGSGCYLSPLLSEGYKYPFYLRAFDTTAEELASEGDSIVVTKLGEKIAASKWVSKAVVLAMDGVIGEDGVLDYERTQVYVPNEYVASETAAYDNLLYGASVNPNRPDALSRLEQAKRDGAVLIKWIPAIMAIDPADPSLTAYYHKLVELDLPLLTHAGQERSFAHAEDELGDPLRLELPLSLGVTVIAAHIATTGENEGQDNFERIMPLFEKYSNLYTDISSLTQVNKLGFLVRALDNPALIDRMVFGTDWPLQFFPLVSPWYQIRHAPLGELKAIQQIDNQWDRDVALKRALGVPDEVFERGAKLLLSQ